MPGEKKPSSPSLPTILSLLPSAPGQRRSPEALEALVETIALRLERLDTENEASRDLLRLVSQGQTDLRSDFTVMSSDVRDAKNELTAIKVLLCDLLDRLDNGPTTKRSQQLSTLPTPPPASDEDTPVEPEK